jgi:tight adherence protein B
MTTALLIAALFFLITVTLIVGLWWALDARRVMKQRLANVGSYQAPVGIIRRSPGDESDVVGSLLEGSAFYGRLTRLVAQSGTRQDPASVVLIILAFALVGGALAWLRTGGLFWGLVAAPIAGALPVAFLAYRRQQRMKQFEAQFPEALDMLCRAIRAGHALSGAIQLVGEEIPDPVGQEFRRVSEEINLGMDPGEALARLEQRAPIQDMSFFCTAIRIQRGSGGNLAEVLERLAEVIRERFKILSYARVLSAQHKWSAIFVGLSPVIMAVIFQLIQPGYFDALLGSPMGPYLIGAGLILECIGFFMIYRIAKIEV